MDGRVGRKLGQEPRPQDTTHNTLSVVTNVARGGQTMEATREDAFTIRLRDTRNISRYPVIEGEDRTFEHDLGEAFEGCETENAHSERCNTKA